MSERIRLIVDQGRVNCPAKGRDVEVDDCLACERLDDADLDAPRPLVVCSASARKVLSAD